MFRVETAELTRDEIPMNCALAQRLVPGDHVYLDTTKYDVNLRGPSGCRQILEDVKDDWYELAEKADGPPCAPMLSIKVGDRVERLNIGYFLKARLLQSMH